MMHVILSGASGGGKSSILDALRGRGFATVPEPGRRIVKAELSISGEALPWVDLAAFSRKAFEQAIADRANVSDTQGPVIFDRGLIDAAVSLAHTTNQALDTLLRGHSRFHQTVFLTPPWKEIYVTDPERQNGFESGVEEYHRLVAAYDHLGYTVRSLPKKPLPERVDEIAGYLSGLC